MEEDEKRIVEWFADSEFDIRPAYDQQGLFTPEHTRFAVTVAHGDAQYETEYQCNTSFSEATPLAVMRSISADAAVVEHYDNIDDLDAALGFDKPSRAIKAWEGCKAARDALIALGFEKSNLAALEQYLNEADEEAFDKMVHARRAELHPPLPEIEEGWSRVSDLMDDLDVGELGDELDGYGGNVAEAISEIADGNVDIYTSDLFEWIGQPDNGKWIDEAKFQGLLEGVDDFEKMIRIAQYECYTQELYDHLEDSVRHAMLSALKDDGVYAVSPDTIDLLDEIDCDDNNADLDELREQGREIVAEHGGIVWDRGDAGCETIPFSETPASELEDERHAAAAKNIDRLDAVFGRTEGQKPGHGIDYSTSRAAEEARHSKASEPFDLDAALDKAEEAAKSEQESRRDDASLQASRDVR